MSLRDKETEEAKMPPQFQPGSRIKFSRNFGMQLSGARPTSSRGTPPYLCNLFNIKTNLCITYVIYVTPVWPRLFFISAVINKFTRKLTQDGNT